MNSVAVCINCGKGKAAPFDKCRACGFLPRLEDDLVKSIYLSTGRYDTPEEQISYLSELEQASRALMAGYSVRFVPEELVRLRQKRLADEPLIAPVDCSRCSQVNGTVLNNGGLTTRKS